MRPLIFNDTMRAIGTVLLLVLSNIFMTFAWYGHLKLQKMKVSTSWPLILVILFSWGLAFFEYCAQVPANRLGFNGNGGPFSLMQLKVIQEVVSLIVFTLVVTPSSSKARLSTGTTSRRSSALCSPSSSFS